MFEQKILVVETENTINGTILRFGPMGNKSHRKMLINRIQEEAANSWKGIQSIGNPDNLTHNDVSTVYYNNIFPTLEILNSQGWKLESFAIIYDSNELRMQVAIFSRNLEVKVSE